MTGASAAAAAARLQVAQALLVMSFFCNPLFIEMTDPRPVLFVGAATG
jgi:hypothetical protein